jgi:all-trans-nonaprenyl-diphosphate synthase
MEQLTQNLKALVGSRHPLLMAAADQIFDAGGKRVRPALVLLASRACASGGGITKRQSSLAEITEMIHTASLVHDDVLDECELRRGAATVNSTYGSRVAVLVGDFLFAQASWGLAQLDNLEVIKLISQVIADFADGEIRQAQALFDVDLTMEDYLDKSFWKTASLLAASCRSAALLGEEEDAGAEGAAEVAEAMYGYGKHLGLAFQVVDDILDFTQDAATLGKEAGQDLASGNLTAPAIFALRHPEHGPKLRAIIESEFTEGTLEEAIGLVEAAGGIEEAMELAREEGAMAYERLAVLEPSDARHSMEGLIEYVLRRIS